MAVEMQIVGARLDYSPSVGIKAWLEVVGTKVRIRLDLPTWEWIEATVSIDSILTEIHRSAPARRIDDAPLLHAGG